MRVPSALEDIKVLDLCDQAGTYCGKLLAEMGADVVLVEPPGGSPMRRIGPLHPEAPPLDASLFFRHYNVNKRSIVLDLEAEDDRHQLLHLTEDADIIVESFPPGHLAARKLGYDTLRARNPGVVVTSITSFGQSGPYRDFRASDLIAQALGGLAYVNGRQECEPLQGIGLPAYHAAAIWGAIGSLLALLDRSRTGRGQWIDVSIHACAAAALEHATSLYRSSRMIPRRTGELHWTRAFRTGRCRDGHVTHGVMGDWTTLAEWVDADLEGSGLTDPRWNDPAYRDRHHDRLFAVLDRWAADKSASALAEAAQLRRLPYASLQPPSEVLANPQLRARSFFFQVRDDSLPGPLEHPGAPYVFSRSPRRPPRRAPRLGEHDAAVFAAAPASRRKRPSSQTQAASDCGLKGLRILDFTWAVAGPLATRVLADQGADVIKVERPGTRREAGIHDLAMSLNRGKRSIAIDMDQPRGVALARALVAECDVVIDNFSPRVMRNWGLDGAALRRRHPRLISIGMSGFGADGPLCEGVSYGPTLQAVAGHSLLMRQRDAPVGWGFSYSDTVAGHSAALAIVMALWQRQRSGEGQQIDLSQLETLVAVTGPILLAAQGGAVEPPGNDTQEAEAAPHGIYRCTDEPEDAPASDRWCAIAVFGDGDWRRFVAAIGAPAWASDRRFETHAARRRHRKELDQHVSAWTGERRAEDVMRHLQYSGVAAGLVANAKDLCERDLQLRQRGYWARVEPPQGSPVEIDGTPLLRDGRTVVSQSPPPTVGEHTDAVLSELLGLDVLSVDEFRRDRIVS